MSSGQPQKRVSVVVANYNMGRYVVEAVESILAQTYPVHEVNVVDDGSTDNSRDVLRRYQDHPVVRVFLQPNGGQAKAKNKGIREATGEFIAFLDADDLWIPEKLERQLPYFDSDPELGVVHTNFVLIRPDGTPIGTPKRTYHDGWIADRLIIDNFVNGMASVVRRECFEKVGLFDESIPMGIDYDLWLRISPHYKFLFVDEKAYLYRQWEGQMSHRHGERYENAVRIMQRFIDSNPGLLSRSTIREAWAHTYVGRGWTLRQRESGRAEALRFFCRALVQKPTYVPAWKSIIRTCVGM